MKNANATKTEFIFADLDNSQRQTLANKLLTDHPMRSQNPLVEFVLKMEHVADYDDLPFTSEDITNNTPSGFICLSNEGWVELTEEERDQKLEELEAIDLECVHGVENLQDDLEVLKDMDFDKYPEILQWFACSDWLIRELEEKGQCTLDQEFWGRQCFGQSVILDHVIQEIAFEYACDYGKNFLTLEQFNNIK